ncbi:MAG TPA: hypothetical protein VLK84_11750 [Longimicrobium sp.]|nr:hypothetical protein [Longimicrobium sp.]
MRAQRFQWWNLRMKKTGESGGTGELATIGARVSLPEARSTAEEVLSGQGRVGAEASPQGGAYVFAYHPYPGVSGSRALPADPIVTVTPLDHDHVRVQVAGVTVGARVRVRRDA